MGANEEDAVVRDSAPMTFKEYFVRREVSHT